MLLQTPTTHLLVMRRNFLLSLLVWCPALVHPMTLIATNDFSIALPRLPKTNRVLAGYDYDDPPWTPSDPCPRTIHVALPSPNGPDGLFNNISTVHSALVHCPRVEELNFYSDDGWCRGNHVELHNYTLPTIEEVQYPALRKLVLDGYRFGGPWLEEPYEAPEVYAGDTCVYPLRELETLVQGWRRESTRIDNRTNLARSLDIVDWGRLEDLSINWGRNPEQILVTQLAGKSRLKNLKILDIASLDFIEALDNNTLTELRWVGPTAEGTLESILAHQGQSLRKLEYRCDEVTCAPEFSQTFNIHLLPAGAPKLEHISINVPRNGTLPFDDLRALASMPNLQSADLYFRMQSDCHAKEEALGIVPDCMWMEENDDSESCNGTSRYQLPYINRTTAETVFDFMRDEKQGTKLDNITLWAGDWRQPSRRGSFMSWRRARVTCTAQGIKRTCKAQNPLYYKGLWANKDWKLGYASDRLASGIERTDEELLNEYNRLSMTKWDERKRVKEQEEAFGQSARDWIQRMYSQWLESTYEHLRRYLDFH